MAFVGNNLGLTSSYYPASDGFLSMTQITLQPGEYLQKIGEPSGTYVSSYFTDPFSLSLPYNQIPNMYNPTIYQVTQPITVNAGPAAPWFGQYGGGMQYDLGKSIAELIVEGILRRF